MLSPSRVLILVENQHSELLKFHTATLIEHPLSTKHYAAEVDVSGRASDKLFQAGGAGLGLALLWGWGPG